MMMIKCIHMFTTETQWKVGAYYDGCLPIKFNFAGPSCVFAGNTKLPYGQKPLMLYNGEVSCLTLSGKVFLMCSISCTLNLSGIYSY